MAPFQYYVLLGITNYLDVTQGVRYVLLFCEPGFEPIIANLVCRQICNVTVLLLYKDFHKTVTLVVDSILLMVQLSVKSIFLLVLEMFTAYISVFTEIKMGCTLNYRLSSFHINIFMWVGLCNWSHDHFFTLSLHLRKKI